MLNEPESAAASWPARMVQQFGWRALDWRWQRALMWAQRTDRRRWKDEDQWTQEAAFALRPRPAWYRPPRAIAERLQRIQTAQALAENPTWQTTLRQAWLLAGLSITAVAERLQEPPEAVDWYERLFFDVRDRLQARFAIATVVMGQPLPAGPWRCARLLKQLAYYGGPAVLETAIPVLRPLMEGKHPENLKSLPYYEQIQRLLLDTESLDGSEWLRVLQPLETALPAAAPIGTNWRRTSRAQLEAALLVPPPPNPVGQVQFA